MDERLAAYPSGNGTTGGDFDFRIHVLPGDYNQDDLVDVSDIQQVAAGYLQGNATTVFTDGNGDEIARRERHATDRG